MNKAIKILTSLPIGFIGVFVPLLPLIGVCLVAVIADVITAWRLSVRLKRKGKSTGKLKSKNAGKVIWTIIEFMLVLILAHLVDVYVLTMFDGLYLPNWTAAIFCAVQGISILENISSENEASWAKVLQKVLADKASRHYDVDITN